MPKTRLNPGALAVSSFPTTALLEPAHPDTTLTDPTAATYCDDCPPPTIDKTY